MRTGQREHACQGAALRSFHNLSTPETARSSFCLWNQNVLEENKKVIIVSNLATSQVLNAGALGYFKMSVHDSDNARQGQPDTRKKRPSQSVEPLSARPASVEEPAISTLVTDHVTHL